MDREDKFITKRGDLEKITQEEARKQNAKRKKEIEQYEKENGLEELIKKYFG